MLWHTSSVLPDQGPQHPVARLWQLGLLEVIVSDPCAHLVVPRSQCPARTAARGAQLLAAPRARLDQANALVGHTLVVLTLLPSRAPCSKQPYCA